MYDDCMLINPIWLLQVDVYIYIYIYIYIYTRLQKKMTFLKNRNIYIAIVFASQM